MQFEVAVLLVVDFFDQAFVYGGEGFVRLGTATCLDLPVVGGSDVGGGVVDGALLAIAVVEPVAVQ